MHARATHHHHTAACGLSSGAGERTRALTPATGPCVMPPLFAVRRRPSSRIAAYVSGAHLFDRQITAYSGESRECAS
jgi:hypothetical protein